MSRNRLTILEKARDYNLYEKQNYERKKAVLLTALAQQQEQSSWQDSLNNASQAHRLATDLVPAAILLARLYIRQGKNRKATKILLTCWEHAPHPDLARDYVYVATSARERLKRAQNLLKQGENYESLFVVAKAALEAGEWKKSRAALEKIINERAASALIVGGRFGRGATQQ